MRLIKESAAAGVPYVGLQDCVSAAAAIPYERLLEKEAGGPDPGLACSDLENTVGESEFVGMLGPCSAT